MAIFDIEKNDLLRLSDVLLEELIARLAEAEVSANGHSPAYVRWSGSINASDGGIDIHVQVPVENLSTGFLERPDTILQAKKHSMPRAAIQKEMSDNGQLSATIAEQASKGGSYIIVSLADDCSPTKRAERLKAMQDVVRGTPNFDHMHLDFYDRSKLAQWLRQHPSVLLWVKEKLGQGYSGWKPYGTVQQVMAVYGHTGQPLLNNNVNPCLMRLSSFWKHLLTQNQFWKFLQPV
ncbi:MULTISPECIES: hypothetical protein [unclassified Thalassolituus]|uniref:hypothetical protein n=1 Tax=unclassified Thalassolituus TaxID=2624967 RepID=UPI0025FFC520|nr:MULTISPECIES: hypothetical protein [unclassified Thalassolituus]